MLKRFRNAVVIGDCDSICWHAQPCALKLLGALAESLIHMYAAPTGLNRRGTPPPNCPTLWEADLGWGYRKGTIRPLTHFSRGWKATEAEEFSASVEAFALGLD